MSAAVMTSAPPIRVVWADDAPWLRTLMAQSLADAGFDVVGEASNLPDALAMIRRLEPDVALLDLRMPPTQTNEGLVAAQELRAAGATMGLMILSEYPEIGIAQELVDTCGELGGVGYQLKSRVAGTDELAAAIRRVCAGEIALDVTIIDRLFARRRANNPLDGLSDAQYAVLRLVAEGLSNKAIGERLCISERTVETHVSAVFDRLGLERTSAVHRRVLATILFLRYLLTREQ